MTTELEKQFFDTFGIVSIHKTSALGMSEAKLPIIYPKITDRHYLELICMLNGYLKARKRSIYEFASTNIDDIKTEILGDCIDYFEFEEDAKEMNHQVQQLFKE